MKFVNRFVLFSLVYGLLSCAHASPKWRTVAILTGDGAADQRERAVAIDVSCSITLGANTLSADKWGSGTIVESRTIITAKHVISCPLGFVRTGLFAVDHTGAKMNVDVENIGSGDYNDGGADTARLVVAEGYEGWPDIDEVEYADPVQDGVVCIATALPKRTRRCGVIDEIVSCRVHMSYVADYGNSGSGVYDANGNFVAVLTRLALCSHGQVCGSVADMRFRWYDMAPK